MDSPVQTRDVIAFGPFNLIARERLLLKDSLALPLGARALDILVALVSRPNQTVAKDELMAEVWPDVTVAEGSLRFHVAELRKVLGDGKDGARYITTLAGRGYCFVAPVVRSSDPAMAPAIADALVPRTNLPSRLSRMVGRADGVLMVASQLSAARFVTIVGAGGVGKTTIAVAVGHDLMEAFAGAVRFVDLGMLRDANLVAASIASLLGLSVQSDDPTPGLIAYLRDKRFLLILDNCEHLVEAAATLAARIFAAAPRVHILATSREALRVEGEHVYALAPLAFPSDEPALTAEAALTYPAVQLFVERARANGARLDLSESDAATVANICRKLDGVALAIELAAARVAAYGLQQTAALLQERLSLLWQGQRTAPPRQQTLKATLDWSFELLSPLERQVLRQLAVFLGDFTLDAALAILAPVTRKATLVFGAIDGLVAKSMVATRAIGAMMRYRLLDATRAYILESQVDGTELADLPARHAAYYRRWLELAGGEPSAASNVVELMPNRRDFGNIRAALEWCFGAEGNVETGIGLAAAAAPFFLAASLLTECQRWSARAIQALDGATRGGREEMQLQAAVGVALMFTRGNTEDARLALSRSLAIAEARGDTHNELRLLGLLHLLHHRMGDLKTSVRYAKRSAEVSQALGDPAARALAHSLLGISLHHIGDHDGARAEAEAALQLGPSLERSGEILIGFDHYNLAEINLAVTRWLQGHPMQALERAHRTVKNAASKDHPVTLSIALSWAVSIFLWTGDLRNAEGHIERLAAHAESHSLAPFRAVAQGFRGALAIRRGNAETGITDLLNCRAVLRAARYELLLPKFNIALAQGHAALGRFAEAITIIEETVRLVEVSGALTHMPELLRVKGSILVSTPQPSVDDAEACFLQSLDWSRQQNALAWELRTAIDLAALWVSQDRAEAAQEFLEPIFGRFLEGFETADLKAAERLLTQLGRIAS